MTVRATSESSSSLLPEDVVTAAQLACLLEASAPKPGNVSPGRHFHDARYEEFLASAAAIGGPLAGAGHRPLGETVLLAIDATSRWTRSNTNLGIVLLLTPLARAATSELESRRNEGLSNLRSAVRAVLESSTVDDAKHVFAAIRRVSPGGLGRAESQDVADDPTMPLIEVMRLAAGRDGIAREYSNGFAVTFETGAPALAAARRDGLSWDEAIVETYLKLLAASPDTHVARRSGEALAAEVSRHAQSVLDAGGVRSKAGVRAIADMDVALRDARNAANPGTTADLTAAAIFVALLQGGWQVGSD